MGGGRDVVGMAAAAELGSSHYRLNQALALTDFGSFNLLAPRSQSPPGGAAGHLAQATRDPVEVARRLHAHPKANYYIRPHPGHFIVDHDAGDVPWTIPPTPTVETGRETNGRRHRHIYLSLPAAWRGWQVKSKIGAVEGIDICGSAGGAPPYVVGPGSIHPNGRVYSWAAGLAWDQVPVAEAPPRPGAVATRP